ncbi:putative VP4 [Microviridae sp.]|nr:putative VP4 [Microviridae sp.]
MKCRKPYIDNAGRVYGCGQCMPCRINRRRVWAHRIMMETKCHGSSAFVTLTYDQFHLPAVNANVGRGTGSVRRDHVQLWMKRLRRQLEPLRIRFYCVGEYGAVTERPHYHVILFGFQACARGRTKRFDGRVDWMNCCEWCRRIGQSWRMGDIELGEVNAQSSNYAAEYCLKKMTAPDDPRLLGRKPEFRSGSIAIGAGALGVVAAELIRYRLMATRKDVPNGLNVGKKFMPLGRYLQRRLRELVGRDASCPQEVLDDIAAEMQAMRSVAWEAEIPFVEYVTQVDDGRYAQMMAKAEIFKRKDSL